MSQSDNNSALPDKSSSELSLPELRVRQIALVAAELAPVEALLSDIFGIKVCYRDPGVAYFGLENALFPIGDQLLEVVAPTKPGTAGGRYLDRRGGDGGYMVITQCLGEHEPFRRRVEERGVRIAHEFTTDGFRNMQLHPKDTGGTFFEIDQQLGTNAYDVDGPWEPAGPDWQRYRCLDRVSAITAANIQCADPKDVAGRWSGIAGTPLTGNELRMSNAVVRFVDCTDGRPDGLSSLDLAATDIEAIVSAAQFNAVPVQRDGDSHVTLNFAGMRFYVRAVEV